MDELNGRCGSVPRTETNFHTIPGDVQAYATTLVEVLHGFLKNKLVGVYIGGSVALGGYVHGRSDIDIQAVCTEPLVLEEKQAIAKELVHPSLPCPARGCEFVLYSREQLKEPVSDFEMNLNSGPQMPKHVTFNGGDESAHWFIIDRDIMRGHGISVFGSEPMDLFWEIPRTTVLSAVLLSLRWYKDHDDSGYSGVLSACRGWLFAEENRWTSKAEAAEWARTRVCNDSIIVQSLALHAGINHEELMVMDVLNFIDAIIDRVGTIGCGIS